MKKILVAILIIAIINLILSIVIEFVSLRRSSTVYDSCDTAINTIRIDSIEYNIIRKDTTIYNIKRIKKNEIEKANSITDSSAVELFKQLVSE